MENGHIAVSYTHLDVYKRQTLSTVAFRGTSPSHTQVTWNGMRINNPMLGMTDLDVYKRQVYHRMVGEKVLPYNPKLFDDVYTKVESQTKRALELEQMNTLLCTDSVSYTHLSPTLTAPPSVAS